MTGRRLGSLHRWARAAALMPLALLALLALGCESSRKGPVAPEYLLDFEQTDQLDYTIAWESAVAVSLGGKAVSIHPFGEWVLTVEDGRNILTALTARDGRDAWEYQVGASLEHLRGVLLRGTTVLASTQSDLYFLDIATGRPQSQQRYAAQNAAAAPGLLFGPFLVYGTNDGRIIYHHLDLGLMQAAYRLESSQPITHAPVPLGDVFAIITQSGAIHLMDGVNNSRLWTAAARDPIDTTPAIDENGIYVAGRDQSVWAFRLSDGKMMWRFRCQRPLIDDPKLIDGVLYQAEPGRGFHAIDAATGAAKWTCPAVQGGTVLARKNGQLIIWDKDDGAGATGSTFYRVLERDGSVLGSARADRISVATSDRIENGTIYAMSRAGRIIKLIP